MRIESSLACKTTARGGESGYAYVMALFMVLTVIVGSQVVLRNMVTETRSQRENEMIWRGNQYARAIRMYYHKTGHYPQSQDDLLTGVPNIHFLRSEAVKDPMNKQDGAWRFIYTNASGAIIGSVKYGSMQQMALMDMNGGQMPGAQPATGSATAGGQTSLSGNGASATPAPGTTTTSTTASSTTGGFSLPQMGSSPTTATGITGTGTVLGPLGQPVNGTVAGPQPTGSVEGPVFGGQLIGVGSTVDASSIKVYKGGKKYNQWEFIWNPIEEQALAMQQGLVSGAGAAQPGAGVPGLGLGLPIAPVGGAPAPSGGTTSNAGGSTTGGSNTSGGSSNSTNPTQ
jgi:hypothetical protein